MSAETEGRAEEVLETPETQEKATETARSVEGKPAAGADITRRTLCIGGISIAALLALGGVGLVGNSTVPRPPGGQDEALLMATCVRCQRCYEACPRKIIVPSHLENGFKGMRTPTLDFNVGYCDFCNDENGGVPLCVHVCPTEALSLPDNATALNTIIGLAVIDESTCLAFRNTVCQECYDACPYGAIEMRDGRPYVLSDKCNGCGACENACLSLTAGSIVTGSTERAAKVRTLDAVS